MTWLAFTKCSRCERVERLPDESTAHARLCNGCGGIDSQTLFRVDDPIAELLEQYPRPTVNDIGVPV